LIIVNDGGEPIAVDYGDVPPGATIREIEREHQDQPRTANAGIALASADLITFLDDDDVAYPNNLELKVQAMERSQADMIYFPINVPDGPTMETFPWQEAPLVAGDCAPNLGTVIRKEAFDKIGLYDERCRVYWDWDWQLRAFYANLHVERGGETPVGDYYMYPDSVVRTRGNPVFHSALRERASGKRTNELTLVVPSHNYPQYLPRLIEAMYHQTCPNWQLIIVDDASEKPLQSTLRDWQRYENITVKLSRKNRGTCDTIAKGLKVVETAYCAVIDADNFPLPDYVRQMINYLDGHPGQVGVHCAFAQYVDMKPTGTVIRKAPITHENSIAQPPGTMLAAWRTEVARKILPEFELCPDWDMMLRGTEQGEVGYIDEPLLGWEDHKDSRWWRDVAESEACSEACKQAALKRRA